MSTALDTNILIILLRGKPEDQAQHVADAMTEHDRQGQLVICPLVWAELKLLLDETKLNTFLEANRILVEWDLTPEIWTKAAGAFAQYLENRRQSGTRYYCSACGAEVQVECPQCNKAQGFPRHILPDFLIGAHADTGAYTLITADKGIPLRYFPGLKVINPLETP
jgi:hypothetical protein